MREKDIRADIRIMLLNLEDGVYDYDTILDSIVKPDIPDRPDRVEIFESVLLRLSGSTLYAEQMADKRVIVRKVEKADPKQQRKDRDWFQVFLSLTLILGIILCPITLIMGLYLTWTTPIELMYQILITAWIGVGFIWFSALALMWLK